MRLMFIQECPRELACLFLLVRTQQESETKSKFSPDTESASTLILDFPASGIMRNEYCCLGPWHCYYHGWGEWNSGVNDPVLSPLGYVRTNSLIFQEVSLDTRLCTCVSTSLAHSDSSLWLNAHALLWRALNSFLERYQKEMKTRSLWMPTAAWLPYNKES